MGKKKRQRTPRPQGTALPPTTNAAPRELPLSELEEIIAQARTTPLNDAGYASLMSAVKTLAFLTRELESQTASVKRLRQLLFGAKTEKTAKVLGGASAPAERAISPDTDGHSAAAATAGDSPPAAETPPGKRKGHGRNGASTYLGAVRRRVQHPTLKPGDPCPACLTGTLFRLPAPAQFVRVTGMPPLAATVWELDRLRCNPCGKVFTAPAPAGVAGPKYDESAAAMIATLKYGSGVPFKRLERLQEALGIPLPASTQWEVVQAAADKLRPVFEELIRLAAQGEVIHNDDTTMKILKLEQRTPEPVPGEKKTKPRTGSYTSGIVSIGQDRHIALFFTGCRHAGENLAEVLKRRVAELPPPIQMSDGLAANTAGVVDTIVAKCLVHARRNFVEVVDSFPEEVDKVLTFLRQVYFHDKVAGDEGMRPEARLRYHQTMSAPIMDELQTWMTQQTEGKLVEPASGLGEAIKHMEKHWKELTLFLRQPGAPLDNNICERALKRAILHRKNAYFYRTEAGALVGDLYMSLIHTAELCSANPFDYLLQIQLHADQAEESPGEWQPWNYRQTLEQLPTNTG